MVTLKEIAAQAGTTISTVSLALRGSRKVSAAKKAEIRKLAHSLGYRRNAHISILMRHIRQSRELPRTATVALLLAHPSENARREFVFIDRRFQGMEQRLAERGYRATTFWYNDPAIAPGRLSRILRARGIQGVAIVPFRQFASIDLDWSNFAVATQGDSLASPALHRSTEDYFGNTLIALKHLWECGYERIGLAYKSHQARGAFFQITAAYNRFFAWLNNDGDEKAPPPHITQDWTDEGFLRWREQHRIDAVLTFDWEVSRWLTAAGLRVPDDMGVAVLNRCPSSPEFSGIDPRPERVGATAVDLVIEQLESIEFGIPEDCKVITMLGRWVAGKTTRPPLSERINTLKLHLPMIDAL